MLGKVKFNTPPFQEQFRQLSANRLPSPDVIEPLRRGARCMAAAARAHQAIDGLQTMPAGPWSDVLATELAHKKAVAAQFADVQKARGTKDYEDALLSFYETLDPQQDAFFVKAVDPDVAAFRDKALARAQDLLHARADAVDSSIGRTVRSAARSGSKRASPTGFRTQARLLVRRADRRATAACASSRR